MGFESLPLFCNGLYHVNEVMRIHGLDNSVAIPTIQFYQAM